MRISTLLCPRSTLPILKASSDYSDGKDGYSRGSLVEGRRLVFLEDEGKTLAIIDLQLLHASVQKKEIIDHGAMIVRVQLVTMTVDIAGSSDCVYTLDIKGILSHIDLRSCRGQIKQETLVDLKEVADVGDTEDFITIGMRPPYIIAYSKSKKEKKSFFYLVGYMTGQYLDKIGIQTKRVANAVHSIKLIKKLPLVDGESVGNKRAFCHQRVLCVAAESNACIQILDIEKGKFVASREIEVTKGMICGTLVNSHEDVIIFGKDLTKLAKIWPAN